MNEMARVSENSNGIQAKTLHNELKWKAYNLHNYVPFMHLRINKSHFYSREFLKTLLAYVLSFYCEQMWGLSTIKDA